MCERNEAAEPVCLNCDDTGCDYCCSSPVDFMGDEYPHDPDTEGFYDCPW